MGTRLGVKITVNPVLLFSRMVAVTLSGRFGQMTFGTINRNSECHSESVQARF